MPDTPEEIAAKLPEEEPIPMGLGSFRIFFKRGTVIDCCYIGKGLSVKTDRKYYVAAFDNRSKDIVYRNRKRMAESMPRDAIRGIFNRPHPLGHRRPGAKMFRLAFTDFITFNLENVAKIEYET